MKKTYIEPKNTVVRLNTENIIASSPTGDVVVKPSGEEITNPDEFGAREIIRSRDAWEEW